MFHAEHRACSGQLSSQFRLGSLNPHVTLEVAAEHLSLGLYAECPFKMANAEAGLFHVEQRNIHTRADWRRWAQTSGHRGTTREAMQLFYFQVDAPTLGTFLVPTSKRRRREFGTGIGSRHAHNAIF